MFSRFTPSTPFTAESRATPTILPILETPMARELSSPLAPDVALMMYTVNASCIAFRFQGLLTRAQIVCTPRNRTQAPDTEGTEDSFAYEWLSFSAQFGLHRLNDVLSFIYRVTGWNLVFLCRLPIYVIRTVRFMFRACAVVFGMVVSVADMGDQILGTVV